MEQVMSMKSMVKQIKRFKRNNNVTNDDETKMLKIVSKHQIYMNILQNISEKNTEHSKQHEVSIDHYEQILDEKEVKRTKEVEAYNNINEEFWKLSEDAEEIDRIRDILYGKLARKGEKYNLLNR